MKLTDNLIRAEDSTFLTEHKFYRFIFNSSLEGSVAPVYFCFYSKLQLWIRVAFDIIGFSRERFFARIWKFNFEIVQLFEHKFHIGGCLLWLHQTIPIETSTNLFGRLSHISLKSRPHVSLISVSFGLVWLGQIRDPL